MSAGRLPVDPADLRRQAYRRSTGRPADLLGRWFTGEADRPTGRPTGGSAGLQGPTVVLCLGPYGGSRGRVFLMSEVPLYSRPVSLGSTTSGQVVSKRRSFPSSFREYLLVSHSAPRMATHIIPHFLDTNSATHTTWPVTSKIVLPRLQKLCASETCSTRLSLSTPHRGTSLIRNSPPP